MIQSNNRFANGEIQTFLPASRWQSRDLNQLVQFQAFVQTQGRALPPWVKDKGMFSRLRCSDRFFHTTANLEIKDGWSNELNVPWSLRLCS